MRLSVSDSTSHSRAGGLACFCCPPAGKSRMLFGAPARRAAPAVGASSGARAKAKSAAKPRQRIDVHHHHFPPRYLADTESLFHGVNAYRPEWSPASSIEDMDKGGVATAMLSITAPGVWFGDNAFARRLARESNEYAARMAADYPGRFGSFASLPLPDIEGSLCEIEYALDALKADGIVMMTNVDNRWLGDPAYARVFDELNRRKAVVYTHPTVARCCMDLLPGIPPAVIEFATDTTRAIANLVFSGTATRCPDIRFIFSHAGGTMPFIIERLTRWALRKEHVAKFPKGLLHELKRFYYDTAQAAHPMAMSPLRQLVSISQIVFGTDFPYRNAKDTAGMLAKCGFSTRELQAVDRGNALKMFPRLKVPTG